MGCCGQPGGCSERPVKLDPPVEIRGISTICLLNNFIQPKKEFYAGTPPYPEHPFIVVD